MRRKSRSRKWKKTDQQQEEEDAIDRISELPDLLIFRILSLLDMKDAVKTCVLSKSWKYSWTHVDSIVYHSDSVDYMAPSAEKLEQFMMFVDRTLMQCTCPKIKRFSLTGHFCDYYFSQYSYQEFSFPMDVLVDKWLEFVLGKDVQDLKLGLAGLDYAIPVRFYRSSSLVTLELVEAGKHYGYTQHFNSLVSLESEDDDGPYCYRKTFDVCWNMLKSLYLKCVYVKEEFMAEILLGCPKLETMVLEKVGGLSKLSITSPSVRELKLLNLSEDFVEDNTNLDITAPWVIKLEVSGTFYCFDCNLVSVASLKHANLTLSYGDFDHVDGLAGENDDYVWCNMIDKLVEPVCHVDELVIGAELLQALSVSELTSEPSLIFGCIDLTIHSPICVQEVPGIVCLLESSPNLENLVINVNPWQCHRSTYCYAYEYTTYINEIFTSFDGVDYLIRQKEKFPCLKNVKIDCREKLYSGDEDRSGDDDKCFELEITAYIIKHAPFLDKLVILSSKSNCSKCGALYFNLLSSKRKVGKKAATQWELKKMDTMYEYSFSR